MRHPATGGAAGVCGSSHRSRLCEEVTRLAAPLQPRTQLPVREADECLHATVIGFRCLG